MLTRDAAERRIKAATPDPTSRRMPPRPGPQPLRGGRRAGEDRPAVEEPLQVVGHFLRRRVAVGRLLAERLQDDGLQLRRDRRLQGTGGRGLVVGDLPDQGVAIAPVEGGSEREQLVERGAERIDVAAVIDDPAPGEDLLGAGVAQRAEHLARDREPDVPRDLGQAEVGDPELTAEVQQQVPRLDVAMHDPRLVGVLQRQRRLPAQPGHAGRSTGDGPRTARARSSSRRMLLHPSQVTRASDGRLVPIAPSRRSSRSSTQFSDQRGEALPLDELHGVIVDAALAADRVHRHDLLVLHVGRRECLGLEALEAPRIDGRGEREDLQRDSPPQRDLLGLVNDPHPASAHLAQEAKVAQLAEARGGSSGSSGRGRPVRARARRSASRRGGAP